MTEINIQRDESKTVRALGMEMHNPIFFLSAFLVLLFSAITLAFPKPANAALNAAKAWSLNNFDWLYAITPIVSFLFCVGIAISPLGKIRLGGQDAVPNYSVLSWIAMLFSAGVGIGFMFYGAAEPLGYYTNWFGTPLNVEAGTAAARELATATAVFHWGILAWSIYAIVGLSLAFFAFNRGLPLSVRSAFYPLIGERIWGRAGDLIDLLAVVSTVFGLACTIGIGATQATGGIAYLFGVESSLTIQIALIAVMTCLAIFSVLRGVGGGVKLLSNINMTMAGGLLLFVIIAGPTLAIFKSIGSTSVSIIPDTIKLANWIGRADQQFLHDWTWFYWAWWIAWSPFVGLFIARISKGRTIRQFMAGVLLAPLSIGVVWFCAFGETAISQYEEKAGDLANGIGDASLTLFQMLGAMPFAQATSIIALALMIIFIVTSADSGALVVDNLTSGGRIQTPKRQRVLWAAMLGLTSISLLYGGGTAALQSLQAGTITVALPFSIVVLLFGVCLVKGLMQEMKIETLGEANP